MLEAPSNIKWRLIKIHHIDTGIWDSVRVRKVEQLNQIFNLKDEYYYSIANYQNPDRTQHPTWQIDKKILWYDDIYDIDDNSGDLVSSWNTAINIMRILGKPKQIRFTGAKGYLLDYGETKDFIGIKKLRSIRDNFMIEDIDGKYKIEGKKYSLLPAFDKLDVEVSIDPTRVVRIVGSNNHKTNKECSVIHCPERYNPLVSMTNRYNLENNSVVKTTDTCRPGLRRVSFYIALSNKIIKKGGNNGQGLYVPYIFLERLPTIEVMKNIQVMYNLPSLYIFKTINNYVIITDKPFAKNRCKKIMKAFRSKCVKSFDKYSSGTFSQLWLRTSSEIDEQCKEIYPKPELVMVIDRDYPHLQSWQHYDFIKRHTYIKEMPIQIKPKNKTLYSFRKVVIQ